MGTYGLARARAAAVAVAGVAALVLGASGLAGAAHARADRSGAQPRYVSSEPSPGEALHRAPDRVSITFDEPLDDSSEITVTDDCDRRVDDGNTRVDFNEMSVGVAKKPSGTYTVSYKATGIGGVTGTRFASYQFEVHMGPACDGGSPEHRHQNGNGEDDPGHEHPPGNGHAGDHRGEDHAAEVHGEIHTADRHAGHRVPGHRGPGHRDHHDDEPGAGEGAEDEVQHLGPLAVEGAEPAADGGAVLIGLGLAMALGILGGWVLRIAPS